MRKLILFLLFALSFSLFAIDSSRLDFTAYNNQDFSTEGTLKISVKDLISNSYSNSISSFVTQLKNPTLNSEFEAFQILVKSNIGNKVSISVSVSDFENPRFPNDKLSVNLGYLYENIVAQCLASNGNELFYHTIMNENSKHNYEVDFILARKNKIIPIEVKSSGYKTHKSLDVFTEKYSGRIWKRYLVYTKDMSKDQDIFCVPVYMVPFL